MDDAPLDAAAPLAAARANETWVQAALCVAAFLASLNFFAPTPFYPVIARDLHTTVPLLGQVVTLMALISAGLGLAVGPLADRYGFRWPLVIGLLAIAVNMLGMGLAPVYGVLLGLGTVGGLGDALVFALPLAIAGTYFVGDARRRAIGLTIGALSTAPIVGVPVLTAFGDARGWRAALAVAGIAGAAAAWFVAAALPPDHRAAATPLRPRALLAAYAPLLTHPASLRLFAVSGLRAMSWLGLLTYLGAYLGQAVGLESREIGIVYMLAGGGYVLGSFAAGGRLGGIAPRGMVAAASVATGLLLAPMLIVANLWVVLPLLVAASFASSAVSVGVTSLLAAESPAGAGATMVLNGSILNLGAAGSAALGGALIALGGYPALGIGLPIFAFAAAILAAWPAAPPRATTN